MRYPYLALALVTLVGVGCQTPRHPAGGFIHGRDRADVPVPPGLDPQRLARRAGDARRRAELNLDQIIAVLPRPDYLPQPEAPMQEPDDTRQHEEEESEIINQQSDVLPPEPPLAAQRAYLAGRLAWHENRLTQAAAQLKKALNLAPDSPPVLRMLGRVYDRLGNKIQAAYYLEQAVTLDPTDVNSLFKLGTYALDQGRSERAIATFGYTMGVETEPNRVDPALWPLMHYYLGTALDRAGYDRAAVDQFSAYLNLPADFGRTTALVREVAFLRRQRGATWQAVGDAYNRLGQPADALEAYRKAAELSPADAPLRLPLARRLVYVYLRLDRSDLAQHIVVERLRHARDKLAGFELVAYLIDSGVVAADFEQQLVSIYEQSDRSPQLALVIADLLDSGPRSQGTRFLHEHLLARPGDRAVFKALIRRLVPPPSTDLAAAARITAAVSTAKPEMAPQYAQTLLDAAGDLDALSKAIDQLDPAEHRAVVHYLKGLLLARSRRYDQAKSQFEQAMAESPELVAARVQLAKLLVIEQRYAEADKLLEPLADRTDSDVVGLRVKILLETDRATEAMALLDRILAQHPTNHDMVLDKAALQLRLNDPIGAERTLLDALSARPEAERLYEALFNLYDANRNIPNANLQVRRLIRRLIATIPHSRLARLIRAEAHDERGEFNQAETLLRGLLDENARDYRALAMLLKVLRDAGREKDADELADQRLNADPNDRQALLVIHGHFQATGNVDRLNDVTERILLLEPASAARARALALFYVNTERPAKAIDVLSPVLAGPVDKPMPLVSILVLALSRTGQVQRAEHVITDAIQRFPDYEADLTLERAILYERLDQRQRAEQIMLDSLKQYPDHAATNNNLGYAWADQGRNLDQAIKMIDQALKAEPKNAMYLDSLGWVFYKLGRFNEAVAELTKATRQFNGADPVIMDHLGDALYREGRKREARQRWRQAMQFLAEQGTGDNAQRERLVEQV
ncbi:MAG: tetratricopeptide repeat protein, partial [Phycisphaeraceae bacterium]